MEIIGAQFPRKEEIGKCVYCGVIDVPLTREHVVPYCLAGGWVLHRASCQQCAKVTRKFERCVAEEQALVIRTIANLPTGRKRERPSSLPLKVKRGGQEETIDVPIEIYPLHLALELYAPPAYIDKRPYEKGISVIGIATRGTSPEKLRKELGIEGYTYKVELIGVTQAQLLAKIALGFAVYKYRRGVIDSAYVRPSILGQREDIGMWVGCVNKSPLATTELQLTSKLHEIRLGLDRNHNICVLVRLFANYGSPEYLVIVGPAP